MAHEDDEDFDELEDEDEEDFEDEDDDEDEDDWTRIARTMQGDDPDGEDDALPFSYLSSQLLGVDLEKKVPLEEAANLLLMREAAAKIRRDQITAEEYAGMVKQVADLAANGIKLFSADVVKKEAAKLPPEQQELVARFERQTYVLKEGTDLMMAYLETGNVDDLDRGLALVEESMRAVDRIQDDAIEMQDEEERSGGAPVAQSYSEDDEE